MYVHVQARGRRTQGRCSHRCTARTPQPRDTARERVWHARARAGTSLARDGTRTAGCGRVSFRSKRVARAPAGRPSNSASTCSGAGPCKHDNQHDNQHDTLHASSSSMSKQLSFDKQWCRPLPASTTIITTISSTFSTPSAQMYTTID